mgnify:FL=1
MKDYSIAGIGEVLWDLFPEYKRLGGGTANFAYHVSQFGFDAAVASALGHDPLGDEVVRTLEDNKVGYLLPQVDFPTGTVQVEVNSDGVPRYDIREQVAWDHIPYTDSLRELARNCCAVCFGSLAQRSEVSRTTINRFLDDTSEESLRIFDINLRQNFYTSATILSSLQKCNILKLNEEEVTLLAQMFGYDELNLRAVCRSVVKDYALQVLILTCGANGSYVFTPDESSYYDTPKVEVADTVGAGDSFTGAFCAALLRGKSIRVAHRLAVDVSAYVCTQQGGMPPLPESLTRRLDPEEGI